MSERRVAVITGSSRDIGKATALRLAAEGVDVAIHSVSTKELGETVAEEARALGVRSTYVQADVRRFDDVASLVETASRELGPINVLVNSAGSAFRTSRAAITAMCSKPASGSARIARISGNT